MKKIFFFGILLLNFYLAPFAYASGLITPDSANSGYFGGLSWQNYPTSTTWGVLYMWSDSSGSSTGWTATIEAFDSSCLATHNVNDVLAVGDCGTESYSGSWYPLPDNERFYGFILKQPDHGGPPFEMPCSSPGHSQCDLDYNTAILNYYNTYTEDQKIGKFCFTRGTAGSCPVEDPTSTPAYQYDITMPLATGTIKDFTAWQVSVSPALNYYDSSKIYVRYTPATTTYGFRFKDLNNLTPPMSYFLGSYVILKSEPLYDPFQQTSTIWYTQAQIISPTGTIIGQSPVYSFLIDNRFDINSTSSPVIGIPTDQWATSSMAQLFSEEDCSQYSGSIFSSSTLDAIFCYAGAYAMGGIKNTFIPGRLFEGTGYSSFDVLGKAFNAFKGVPPFSIFYMTMADIESSTYSNISSTLAIQVPIQGSTATTTNITIASPTFGKDTVGATIWEMYTNLFILGAGLSSIAGIVAIVFML